jgi:hypothetical protein
MYAVCLNGLDFCEMLPAVWSLEFKILSIIRGHFYYTIATSENWMCITICSPERNNGQII